MAGLEAKQFGGRNDVALFSVRREHLCAAFLSGSFTSQRAGLSGRTLSGARDWRHMPRRRAVRGRRFWNRYLGYAEYGVTLAGFVRLPLAELEHSFSGRP